MRFKVVNTAILANPYGEEISGSVGAEYVHKLCLSEEELIEVVKEADGAITAIEPYTRRVIETLTKCRVISHMGVGYDNIDVDAATEHGICICNVPDYCSRPWGLLASAGSPAPWCAKPRGSG